MDKVFTAIAYSYVFTINDQKNVQTYIINVHGV